MIQLRWSDETEWKDFPGPVTVRQARQKWRLDVAAWEVKHGKGARPTKAEPEFRVKPLPGREP